MAAHRQTVWASECLWTDLKRPDERPGRAIRAERLDEARRRACTAQHDVAHEQLAASHRSGQHRSEDEKRKSLSYRQGPTNERHTRWSRCSAGRSKFKPATAKRTISSMSSKLRRSKREPMVGEVGQVGREERAERIERRESGGTETEDASALEKSDWQLCAHASPMVARCGRERKRAKRGSTSSRGSRDLASRRPRPLGHRP